MAKYEAQIKSYSVYTLHLIVIYINNLSGE